MKKVAIIGHFGFCKNLFNGQTIKTKIITDELENQFGSDEVMKVDTHGGVKSLFKVLFKTFQLIEKCENIIIFPANRGLQILVPLLIMLNKAKGRGLFYCVIGGWLPELLQHKPKLLKQLKIFDGIFVETESMRSKLIEMDLQNTFVMPNFKKLRILDFQELSVETKEPRRLCTFSRVMKEKGIEDAIMAVSDINHELGRVAFSLDIYGQIDSFQMEWFYSIQKNFPDYINYCGVIQFDKSVEVLKSYFALLFPTYYEGEGFAGTLLDAMAAGIPIIASDWRYNSEIVNVKNGFLFETKNVDELEEKILHLLDGDMISLKKNCLSEAHKYSPENVIKILADKLR